MKPRMPNLFCIGAEKCGTTLLHRSLARHPAFLLPGPTDKETYYFNFRFDRGLDYYLGLFPFDDRDAQYVGDLTPSYFRSETALERIAEATDGDVKIIIMLRHPVYRAFSHYVHDIAHHRGFEVDNPYEVSFFDEDELNHDFHFTAYYPQLERLFDFFRRDQVLTICYETDLLDAPQRAERKLEEFLGVSGVELLRRRVWQGCMAHYLFSSRRSRKVYYKDGIYEISADTLVFCNGYRGESWEQPHQSIIDSAMRSQRTWTRRLTGAQASSLYRSRFSRSTEKLECLLDVDLSRWKSYAPDVSYTDAMPPKQYRVGTRTYSFFERIKSVLGRVH